MSEQLTLADKIWNSVKEEPEKWKVGRFTWDNKEVGLSFWVCNGRISFRSYEKEIRLSFLEKNKIWKAYKYWCKYYPI